LTNSKGMAVCGRSCTGCSQSERNTGRIIVWAVRIPGVESEVGQCIGSISAKTRAPGCVTQSESVLGRSGIPTHGGGYEGEPDESEEFRDHVVAESVKGG